MKPGHNPIHPLGLTAIALVFSGITQTTTAALKTWDSGGADGNWSTALNWNADTVPGATGDTLVFTGTGETVNNDLVTSLATSGTAITFDAAAGSFIVGGNTITLGSGGGGGQTIISQLSASNQVISLNINLSGGNGDRSIVFGAGAGSLTLSGNINFSNDWLFPTTTAGTLILSGNNTGDGKGTNAVTAGTNVMRAMMRNNVAGTQLILGSDTALGNSGTGSVGAGTASFRGILANQSMKIGTAGGTRDLSGSSLAINAGNIDFNGTSNLTIGNIMNVASNRDFIVSSTGTLTVATGIQLSNDQTGRSLYVNLSGAGGMVVNGVISDTFHSGGITTGTSTLRKAGTGTMTLNGSSSYSGLTTIEGGTLKLGHANALGASGAFSKTTMSAGSLDLNGISTAETLDITGVSTLANSSGSLGTLTADTNVTSNFTVNNSGDITATRFIGTAAVRTVTKDGAGTLTTNGTSHNNLVAWQINNGTVVLANTSGYGADRGVTLAGGTLKISGANSDLINDGQAFIINTGAFDLNGKSEAVAAVGGSGGNIRNGAAATISTVYVGGGSGGSSSASYAGVIENGSGTLNLTKEGSGTQTLTGTNTYSGKTTISNGSLALGTGGSISNSAEIALNGGNFNVSALASYTLGTSQKLTGNGTVTGSLVINGELAIGTSPGTVDFQDLTLGSTATYTYEMLGATVGIGSADLGNVGGNLVLSGSTLDLVQLGTYTLGQKFTLFSYATRSGTFGGLAEGAEFTDAGGIWKISYIDTTAGTNGGTGSNFVTITAVPEPTAVLLGGLGLLALLRRRHRSS